MAGVAYYSGRNRVISAGDDEAIFVWDPNNAKPTCTMPFAHDGISLSSQHPNHKMKIVAGTIEHVEWVEECLLLITCGEDLVVSPLYTIPSALSSCCRSNFGDLKLT